MTDLQTALDSASNSDPSIFVLIPSPLNGPLVWAPVARELRSDGISALVVPLVDDPHSSMPYWVQHAASVARVLNRLDSAAVILAGHSGTGPLLPALGAFSPQPVTGYLFVDAGLPIPGRAWLEDLEESEPEFGAQLREQLEAGESFPAWTDEELREIVPDDGMRLGLLAELRPRGLDYFTQPFPSFERWPDAPCGYVQFSAAYDQPSAEARRLGWAHRTLPGGHFHMMVEPRGVAAALCDLVAGM